MNSQTDREKALDKIRKCLALSKSANENEAAVALRQAQKLMEAHNVTEDDVKGIEYTDAFVDHAYPWKKGAHPDTILYVVMTMSIAFSVLPVWECSPERKHRIRYFGRLTNVALACHAHMVVYRAAMRAWMQYRRTNPTLWRKKGSRASFFNGWLSAVIDKVKNLMPEGEEHRRIKLAQERKYGKGGTVAADDHKALKRHDEAVIAGNEAGREFDLNRPLSTDRLRLEKL